MRRLDWLILVGAPPAAWWGAALLASAAYSGDVEPPGATARGIAGLAILLVIPIAIGGFGGRRLGWPLRLGLGTGIAAVGDLVASSSYAGGLLTSPTCPTCDTAAFTVAPFFFVAMTLWLLLGTMICWSVRLLRQW